MKTYDVKFVPEKFREDEKVVLNFLDSKEQFLENPIKLGDMEKELSYHFQGEKMEFPKRNYYKDITDVEYSKFSDTQKAILDCIMSLNYNGHRREKHIMRILQSNLGFEPFFVFNQVQSYVVEILNHIYESEKDKSSRYEAFVKQNLELVKTGYRRMVSYWDANYREQDSKIEDYVGYKIFTEIFKLTRKGVYGK